MVNKKLLNSQANLAAVAVQDESLIGHLRGAFPCDSRLAEVAKKSRAFLNFEDEPQLDNGCELSIFIHDLAFLSMKILVDDIPQSPKEIRFSERIEELNETFAKGNIRDFSFPPLLDVNLTYYRSGQEVFFHGSFAGTFEGCC